MRQLARPRQDISQTVVQALLMAAAAFSVYEGVNILFLAERRFVQNDGFAVAASMPGGPPAWGLWILTSGILMVIGAILGRRSALIGSRLAFAGMIAASCWASFFAISLEASVFPSVSGSVYMYAAFCLIATSVAVKHSNAEHRSGQPA